MTYLSSLSHFQMNSFHISSLLSEALPGECQLSVLERKCICWYIDEQNLQMVPPGRAEAGVEIWNEFNIKEPLEGVGTTRDSFTPFNPPWRPFPPNGGPTLKVFPTYPSQPQVKRGGNAGLKGLVCFRALISPLFRRVAYAISGGASAEDKWRVTTYMARSKTI
jgi:hypothetical protein